MPQLPKHLNHLVRYVLMGRARGLSCQQIQSLLRFPIIVPHIRDPAACFHLRVVVPMVRHTHPIYS